MATPETTYERMKEVLTLALSDLDILAGNKVGPSNASWQDVAATCAVKLQCLASLLNEARIGNCESFIAFPDPRKCMEDAA